MSVDGSENKRKERESHRRLSDFFFFLSFELLLRSRLRLRSLLERLYDFSSRSRLLCFLLLFLSFSFSFDLFLELSLSFSLLFFDFCFSFFLSFSSSQSSTRSCLFLCTRTSISDEVYPWRSSSSRYSMISFSILRSITLFSSSSSSCCFLSLEDNFSTEATLSVKISKEDSDLLVLDFFSSSSSDSDSDSESEEAATSLSLEEDVELFLGFEGDSGALSTLELILTDPCIVLDSSIGIPSTSESESEPYAPPRRFTFGESSFSRGTPSTSSSSKGTPSTSSPKGMPSTSSSSESVSPATFQVPRGLEVGVGMG
mmetsp:Transcript_123/g.239  ORF Transcript_123/g.239 Transcript_123/m.239 type:complete len:314 (-) Transcript_123:1261-2202(-)